MKGRFTAQSLICALVLSGSMMAMGSPLTTTHLAIKKAQEGTEPTRSSMSREKIALGRASQIKWCTEPLDHKLMAAMQRYLNPDVSIVRASAEVILASVNFYGSAESKAKQAQRRDQKLEDGFKKLTEISDKLARAGLIKSGSGSLSIELINALLLNQSDYDVCDHFHRVVQSTAHRMLSKLKEPSSEGVFALQDEERIIAFLEVLARPTVVREPHSPYELGYSTFGSSAGAQ